ncbi:BBP7 family outer membrane beta-barrel protein [Planctomicrobium sp. SH664]|uniref:BBP7 family outer membrane beta-barrel protein n=1 Tax=Planctomicrobium sp. SH664 TaxID=3448125 RepID=UPI003F5BD747
MKLRASLGWLVVAGMLSGETVQAQSWPPAPAAPSVAQAGWGQPQLPPGPQPGMAPYCPQQGVDFDYAQLLPEDRGWCFDTDSRCDLIIRETLKGTWLRLEYLNATIRHQDDTVLGAPLATVRNVQDQFPVTFTDGVTTALAQVPTTAGIDWENINGIKGSIGIPLTFGWIEASVLGLAQDSDALDVPRIPPLGLAGPNGTVNSTFLATTLTTDGQPGTRTILYDADFFSQYTVNYFATDLNLLYNLRSRDEGWNVKTLIGYRHDQYSEDLAFGGTFDNSSGYYSGVGVLGTPVSNRIGSSANNFRNQVQFGIRNEFVHRWFTLGVDPKIAFGTNSTRNRVVTSDVRDPGDPAVILDPVNAVDDPFRSVTNRDEVIFAPTFDLSLYGTVNLTEWLKLRMGWNLIWLGGIQSADRGILFNEVTNPLPPPATTADVVARRGISDRVISSFTVGGEILLP